MLDPQVTAMLNSFVDRLTSLEEHYGVLNDHSGTLTTQMAVIGERVDWLCRFFWITMTGVIMTLATNIWQLIRMREKK